MFAGPPGELVWWNSTLFCAHFSQALALGLVPSKLPTFVDVMHCTEGGWHSPHSLFNAISIHDLLMEVNCPYLKRLP